MSNASSVAAVLPRFDWSAADEATRKEWLAELRPPEPVAEVSAIVSAVREGGDAALLELIERHDGARLESLWASEREFDAADGQLAVGVRDALADAIEAVQTFHAAQAELLSSSRTVDTRPGVRAWRRFVPLRRAGGYVAGGRAALASSVVMLGVPARLAGVDDMVIASPPGRDGTINAAILVAARMVGISRVLKAGGAQAIAALAYGTQSVPRVDRIFGAGGPWVTAAKRAVSSDVAIDLPAGPSECVVLADGAANPRWVAHDLLAQAEHGPDSVAVLVTDAPDLAEAVEASLSDAAAGLATGAAALQTLRRFGRAVTVASLDDGLAVVEEIAPEHVSLQCAAATGLAGQVRNAGAVFVGGWTPVAAGDYATGGNHVLPTGGAARAWSGVGVEAFGHWVTVQEATSEGVRGLAATVRALADAEGLPAHAASVEVRLAPVETA
ncbi:histidinol dehydrogenase [soil metagenome]